MLYFKHLTMKKFFLKNSVRGAFFVAAFLFVFAMSGQAQVAMENSGTIFIKNLTLGSDNSDVATLKQVLNSNPLTSVQKSGLVEEKSTYFGPDTRRAVIKFQELYKETVLYPSGLTKGTGFVGPSTRAKLNELAKNLNLQQNFAVSDPVVSNTTESDSLIARLRALLGVGARVQVNMAENYQVSPQGTLVLAGSGFLPNQNTVHIDGKYLVSNVGSLTGTSLKVNLPKEISLGKHSVWVTNSNGSSRNPATEIYFVVTENPASNPVITSVSPDFAAQDEEIIIKGRSFTPSGNNLYTTLGNVTNISSSGGDTLRVNLSSFPVMAALASNPELKGTRYNVAMYVQNENGVSLKPFMFTIQIK